MKNVARQAVASLGVGTGLLSVVRKDRAAVLRYGRVAGTREEPLPLAVTADEFAAQLKFLKARCRLVRLCDIVDAVLSGEPPPPGGVAITFDCGYEDNFSEAFYQIAQAGVHATFFIAAGWVESKQVLWWDRLHEYLSQAAAEGSVPVGCDELPEPVASLLAAAGLAAPDGVRRLERELIAAIEGLGLTPEDLDLLVEQIAATLGTDEVDPEKYLPMNWEQIKLLHEGGMGLGSYTVSHARLTDVHAERGHEELAFSKRAIESKTGAPVHLVAYPGGEVTEDVADLAEEAGYQAGLTTRSGPIRAGDSPFGLCRMDVTSGEWLGPRGRFSPQIFGLHIRRQANLKT